MNEEKQQQRKIRKIEISRRKKISLNRGKKKRGHTSLNNKYTKHAVKVKSRGVKKEKRLL